MSTTITAPPGAHWAYEEVAIAHGTQSLGEIPLLVWDSASEALNFYSPEGICEFLDGTSARVSFQGIARRLKIKGETDDVIATAQVNFRPGRRSEGKSTSGATPVAKTQKLAKAAAEKTSAEGLNNFLARVLAGDIQLDADGNPTGA